MFFDFDITEATSHGKYHVSAKCATENSRGETTDVFRAGLLIYGDSFLRDKELNATHMSNFLEHETKIKILDAKREYNNGKNSVVFYDNGLKVNYSRETTK